MQFARFIKRAALFLPILFVIIGFNYFVDPANIFRSEKFYKEVVALLLKGKNVANMTNYDERLLQREYINGLSKRREIVVFGSSRVMQISSDVFPGRSFLNNGVSGASIEDDMAIYWMYRQKGFIPAVVILGLDPWLLNKNNGQSRYESINREYQGITKYLEGHDDNQQLLPFISTKYFELISPSYFQSSFWYWLSGLGEKKLEQGRYYSTLKNVANEDLKLADGSISYGIKQRSVNASKLRLTAKGWANASSVYSLDNFTRLDQNLSDKFDKFIALLLEDKVKVIFFLPPYHSAAYHILAKSDKYKIIIEAQSYFKKYAKRNGHVLLGSYNAEDVSLGDKDFYDAMHIKREAINRLFFDCLRQ